MIILLRLRNLTIFALLILSISFIYIGYLGFGDNQIAENQEKIEEYDQISIEPVEPVQGKVKQEDTIVDFDPLKNIDKLKEIDNFFIEFRMQRDKGRDAQIEILRELVNNPNSTPEVREKSQNKLFDISESIALEIKSENLLKAKEYDNAVVVVEKANITVVVENKNLKETDITRISDLVQRATGYGVEQIAIITK